MCNHSPKWEGKKVWIEGGRNKGKSGQEFLLLLFKRTDIKLWILDFCQRRGIKAQEKNSHSKI